MVALSGVEAFCLFRSAVGHSLRGGPLYGMAGETGWAGV